MNLSKPNFSSINLELMELLVTVEVPPTARGRVLARPPVFAVFVTVVFDVPANGLAFALALERTLGPSCKSKSSVSKGGLEPKSKSYAPPPFALEAFPKLLIPPPPNVPSKLAPPPTSREPVSSSKLTSSESKEPCSVLPRIDVQDKLNTQVSSSIFSTSCRSISREGVSHRDPTGPQKSYLL